MDLFDQFVRFETDLWNATEKRLLKSGHVGLATLQALRTLRRHDGRARVHELSAELGVTIGAASKLVDRLERAGLAVRSANPDDRRSSLVALTDRGRNALHDAEIVAIATIDKVLGEPDHARALTTLLQTLRPRLDAVVDSHR